MSGEASSKARRLTSPGQTKAIREWLDSAEDPAEHEVEYAIDVLELEQRSEEVLKTTSAAFAAIGLALVAVLFTMQMTYVASAGLLLVAVSIGLVLWGMVTSRRRQELLIRLYKLRHQPPRPRGWRIWRR